MCSPTFMLVITLYFRVTDGLVGRSVIQVGGGANVRWFFAE